MFDLTLAKNDALAERKQMSDKEKWEYARQSCNFVWDNEELTQEFLDLVEQNVSCCKNTKSDKFPGVVTDLREFYYECIADISVWEIEVLDILYMDDEQYKTDEAYRDGIIEGEMEYSQYYDPLPEKSIYDALGLVNLSIYEIWEETVVEAWNPAQDDFGMHGVIDEFLPREVRENQEDRWAFYIEKQEAYNYTW